MGRTFAAFAAGLILGGTGIGLAASVGSWRAAGISCVAPAPLSPKMARIVTCKRVGDRRGYYVLFSGVPPSAGRWLSVVSLSSGVPVFQVRQP